MTAILDKQNGRRAAASIRRMRGERLSGDFSLKQGTLDLVGQHLSALAVGFIGSPLPEESAVTRASSRVYQS
jgi:hypothetical protein